MAGIDYLDFEVEVARGTDGDYRVTARSGPAKAVATMRLPFDRVGLDTQLRAVQARLLQSGPSSSRAAGSPTASSASTVEAATDAEIRAMGEQLFAALFRDDVRAALADRQREADDRHRGLRIKLELDAAELAALPWEFLFDTERGDYLTLAASTPLVRYVPPRRAPEPLRVKPPLRILGLVASPTGLRPLHVERERQRLELALEGLRGRGDVELVWLGGQSARYLQAALRQGPWHILHFIGHGGFDPRPNGGGFIVLADDDGGPQRVDATNLARLVADHDPMRVVVLNACDGARGNEVDLFSSTAAQLVKQGTPAVVGMQFEITDEAAIEFSRSFYEAIADGTAIDTALGEARKGMALNLDGSLEWGTPVLYTQAADGVLFRVSRTTRPPVATNAAGRPEPVVVFDPADRTAVTDLTAALARRQVTTVIAAAGAAHARVVDAEACLLLQGPSAAPVWADPALQAALARRSHDRDFHLAPVLLPGSVLPDLGRLPDFLAGREWIDLRGGIDDADRLDQLLEALSLGADGATKPILPSDVPPFRGLEAFDEQHADVFFGREALTQQLVEHLRTDRFLAVVGPSGSGKSSVVRAGLIPAVRRGALPDSGAWPVVVLKPGSHPLDALAGRIAALGQPDGGEPADTVRDAVLTQLLQGAGGLDAAVAELLADGPADQRALIVIDQFEEIFTLAHDQAERERFVMSLIEATRSAAGRTNVVVTMRADFIGQAAAIPVLAAMLAEHDILVTPMTREELRRAIVEPARRAGLQFEAGLVDTIMAEVGGESGALPLLEDTLLELWQGRSGGWLTLARYREIGGVRGAIAKRADAVYDGLTTSRRAIARRILLRLVAVGSGAEVTRRRASLAELQPAATDPEAADVAAVLQALVSGRLVTTGHEDGVDSVDVAHEALIANWPRFRGWIEDSRAALRVHRRVADDAAEWEAGHQDPSFLLRGVKLVEASTWADQNRHDANDLERAFVEASVAADRAEVAARRRSFRRRIYVAAGVMAALVVFAGVAGWSAIQADSARAQAETARGAAELARTSEEHAKLVAQAQAASAQGIAKAPTDPLGGLGTALDGWALGRKAGVDSGGFRTSVEKLLASGRLALVGQGVDRLLTSPDGRYAVIDVANGHGELVRTADGATLARLPGDVSSVSWGPPSAGVVGILYADAAGELRRLADGSAVKLSGDTPEFGFPPGGPGTGGGTPAQVLVVNYHIPTTPGDGGGPAPELRSLEDGTLLHTFAGSSLGFAMLPAVDGGRALMWFDDQHGELVRLSDGVTVASFDQIGNIGLPEGGPATIYSERHSTDTGTTCVIRRASDGKLLSSSPHPAEHQAILEVCGIFATSPDGSAAAFSTPSRIRIVRVDSPAKALASIPAANVIQIAIAPGTNPGFLAFRENGVDIWRPGGGAPLASLAGNVPDEFTAVTDVSFSANGAYAAFLLNGERRLVRMATGEAFQLPWTQISGEPIDDVKRVVFGVGTKGDVAQLVHAGGDGEVVLLDTAGTDQSLFGPYGQIAFWPGTPPGPSVGYALNDWGPLLGLEVVAIEQNYRQVVFGPNEDTQAAVVEFYPPDTSLGEAARPSLLVARDGTTFQLRGQVVTVVFSPDKATATLVLGFSDDLTDIWDRSRSEPLGSLGLGVGSTAFDDTGDRLLVRYLTGETYLIDLARLRSLPTALPSLSDDAFLALACGTLGDRAATLASVACGTP